MKMKFIIGVSLSPRSQLWSQAIKGIHTVAAVEPRLSKTPFCKQENLDIEIMATSLVAMRFDLVAPVNKAGVYRLECLECAPLIIVPPVIDVAQLPPDIQTTSNNDVTNSRSRIALYQWRQVLLAVSDEIDRFGHQPVITGFHCDTIGYFCDSPVQELDIINAFQTAYSELVIRVL
jgi:hypothetical protein